MSSNHVRNTAGLLEYSKREQQESLPSPKQIKREMTYASKNVLIDSKNKRISELEDEIKWLKSVLARRYGE